MPPETNRQSVLSQFLITAAAFVVAVAGMRAAQTIIVPFLLSLFLAVASAPSFFYLTKRKVPQWLALIIVLLVLIGLATAAGALVGSSVQSFINSAPKYQAQLEENSVKIYTWLNEQGISIPEKDLLDSIDLGGAMQLAANMLSELSGIFTNGFLILVAMAFMLSEASNMPTKLRVVFRASKASPEAVKQFTTSINRYMAMKTFTSFGTAVIVWLWLLIMGVDYPLLWAFLAFLLNFVPTLGAIIAAVPPVLLALVQLGPTSALITAIGYAILNVLIGNIIEPRIMGKTLGLSTLVVFFSLVFWGWVLGPVGMLLSVPLTMTVKIALESNQETKWIAVLLGSGSEAAAEVLTGTLSSRKAK